VSDPPPDRADQVLRASVTVIGWEPGSEEDVADTIQRVTGKRMDIEGAAPIVVFDQALPEEARNAASRLTAAGAKVIIEDLWVERGGAYEGRARPACPVCASTHTQPFDHAGPASRVNRKCTDCGHLFRSWTTR
jgi:hypothetical protein